MELRNSTVSDNTSVHDGGGIRNVRDGVLILVESAVSGNRTQDDGGGIRNNGGTAGAPGSTKRLHNRRRTI